LIDCLVHFSTKTKVEATFEFWRAEFQPSRHWWLLGYNLGFGPKRIQNERRRDTGCEWIQWWAVAHDRR
jgi:hypothetical protein